MSSNPILPLPYDEEPVDSDESEDSQDTVENDVEEAGSVNEKLNE